MSQGTLRKGQHTQLNGFIGLHSAFHLPVECQDSALPDLSGFVSSGVASLSLQQKWIQKYQCFSDKKEIRLNPWILVNAFRGHFSSAYAVNHGSVRFFTNIVLGVWPFNLYACMWLDVSCQGSWKSFHEQYYLCNLNTGLYRNLKALSYAISCSRVSYSECCFPH